MQQIFINFIEQEEREEENALRGGKKRLKYFSSVIKIIDLLKFVKSYLSFILPGKDFRNKLFRSTMHVLLWIRIGTIDAILQYQYHMNITNTITIKRK